MSKVRGGFASHVGWSVEQHKRYRAHQLQQLKKMLEENEKAICDAVWTDLHKVSVNVVKQHLWDMSSVLFLDQFAVLVLKYTVSREPVPVPKYNA